VSAPGGLLSLHLSNRVGWAYGSADDKPDYGAWRLPEIEDHGEIGAAFFDALGDSVKINRPKVIAISAPLTADIAPEIDSLDRALACCRDIGLAFAARVYAYRRSLRVAIVNPDDVRQQMLGRKLKGFELDEHACGFCRRHGWEPKHPAAGHALMLWRYALELRAKQ
jgi:hypothetical protein